MDFQFKKDILGQPVASFSMGHETIGRWLTDELGSNSTNTLKLIDVINNIEQSSIGFREITGKELQLSLSISGVEVSAIESDYNSDMDLQDEFDEATSLYEGESFSECGLLDFKQALLAWLEFIS